MRAIVTGATGCVGWHVANQLVENGWDVTVVHRRSSDLSRLGTLIDRVSKIEADLTYLSQCVKVCDEGADAIFHAAGNTSHWKDFERQRVENENATRNLAAASIGKVSRFIFTSTGATMGLRFKCDADVQREPVNYIKTKRLAESALERMPGLDYVILNPIIVLGTHDWHNYSQLFQTIKQGDARYAIPGSIHFLDARDLAAVHLAAFHHGKSNEYYTVGGNYHSWFEFYTLVAEQYDVPGPVGALSSWVVWLRAICEEIGATVTGSKPMITRQVVRLLREGCDISFRELDRTHRELGYTPRPLRETIAHIIQSEEGLL